MKDWIKLQRELYRRVQVELRAAGPKESKALQTYAQAYKRDFRSMRITAQETFFSRLKQADYLFVGDFHSLSQSQKFLLRLLRRTDLRKPKAVALEALRPQDEELVRRYFRRPSKKLQEQFLDRMPLEEWGSSHTTYLEIIEECRRQKIQINGLASPEPSLHKRDKFAIQRLKLLRGSWVLFGEFHCARPHLPQLLLQEVPNAKICVLQQNEDKLLQAHLSEFSKARPIFLRSQSNHKIDLFCVLHTPRWVKWQSFLDHQIRRDEFESPIDASEQIKWSLKSLSEFLHDSRYAKPLSEDDLLDFNVIEAEDEDFSELLKALAPKKRRLAIQSLENTRVAALAHDRRIFITEKTLNSCSQAAALYLYQAWSDQEDLYGNFYRSALTECLCFFLSKILNHSRKAKHWRELRSSEHAGAKLAWKLQNFGEPSNKTKAIFNSKNPDMISAGILIGRILADRLFEAFLAGEFSKQRLNRLLLHAPRNRSETFERLVELQSVGRAFEPSSTL